MSILNRTNLQATEQNPLYVKFGNVTRTGKDSGVTIFDSVAKFGDETEFKFEGNRITLYDSHFGPKGQEGPLTNPCIIYKSGDYWNVRPVPEGKGETVLASPKDAEKPAVKEWSGGGGGGGGKNLTKAELDAAIAYSIAATGDVSEAVAGDAAAIFCKILGCAMFVDWSAGKEEGGPAPTPVTDDDIPFSFVLPFLLTSILAGAGHAETVLQVLGG